MERNFSVCPHCARAGRQRAVAPSTPRTPLVSRSDGETYHLFLEESNLFGPFGSTKEIAGLFRYDLDPARIKADSTLVRIPYVLDRSDLREALEKAADALAALLENGRVPCRLYVLEARRGLVEASSHFGSADSILSRA